MSNASFSDGRIKIGMSSKDPLERKSELESSGVPEPFVIEYKALVEDYQQVEQKIHRFLDQYRPNKKREFFTCTIPEAIIAIRNTASIAFEEINYQDPEEIRAEEMRRQAKERIWQEEKEKARKRTLEKEAVERRKRWRKEEIKQEKTKSVLSETLSWTFWIGAMCALGLAYALVREGELVASFVLLIGGGYILYEFEKRNVNVKTSKPNFKKQRSTNETSNKPKENSFNSNSRLSAAKIEELRKRAALFEKHKK